MNRSTVASLAILKVNYERHGKDYIHNFVPFVVECLRDSADDVVALPALQKDLHTRFGLTLPLNPLRQILQRAASDGYLRKDSGVYYRNVEACEKTDFSATESQVEEIEKNVVTAVQRFAREEHKLEWTEAESEEALLSFIGDSGLDVLYAEAEQTVLPQPTSSSGATYVVGTFVAACRKDNADLFDGIETIIKGALLANALYLPDHGKVAQRFRHTKVFLDTTFLIFAVGYAGEDRQAPCGELLELLKSYGAELSCFQETVEEARGILDACAAKMRRGELRDASGPTIEYFITRGLLSTDVDLMAARLPNKLALLGITVHDRPTYEREFVIDESGFEQHLKAKIGYFRRPKALQHDVDCIAAIARIREGRESFAVEDCRAVFVTTNAELARATRSFFQSESTPKAVALCISDYALGNLMWLKNPTKAPDLPRRRLIADAFAAMEPTEALWRAYLVEIARLESQGNVTPDDYLLLRHSVAAKAALMDLTKGDPAAFTQGRVTEILEVAKRTVRADLEQELVTANALRARQETDLAKKEEEHAGRIAEVRRVAMTVGSVAAWAAFGITLTLLAVATLYTFPWQLPSLRAAWFRYALAVVQVALLVYGVASMGWGTTLRDLAKRLETRIAASVEIRIRRKFRI